MQVSIGKQLKQVLDIDSSIRIGFLAHVRTLPAVPVTSSQGFYARTMHHWACCYLGCPVAIDLQLCDILRWFAGLAVQSDAKRDDRKAKDRYLV